MTHPFRPLAGRDFEFVAYRQNWGEDRVHLHDENGQLFSLPAAWTDAVAADPFVVVAAGRAPFSTAGLLALADLAGRLRAPAAAAGSAPRSRGKGPGHERAPDLLRRDFTAPTPNRRWVADFTHVATLAGTVYVAFAVDIFSRMIVGWAAARHKRARLVLDALDMALWHRARAGRRPGPGLIHHCDAGSQYTSIAFTAHLAAEGIVPSIGTVGDALGNALMESAIGLYKTELITRRGPWRDLAHVEMETAGYVQWFSHRRIHPAIGDVTPAEREAAW